MNRDTLIRSLAALSAQIAEVRREAFGAGVRALPGRYSDDELRCDPDLARDEEIRRNIHIERRKTLEGILVRLEVVRRALDEDTLVWEAQRKTYERTIAAVYRTAAELNAQVPASSTEAAPPSALLQPPREGDAPDDEPIVTRDTLLSAAATPVVEKRCEALSSRGTNRYVNRRAGGHLHHEYVRYDSGLGAWLLCDERTARTHPRWRRIRHPGQPWCPVLGGHVTIASDAALQAFFVTIGPEEWRRLELAVRLGPSRCLREWRAQGDRLIAAVHAAAGGRSRGGKLSSWPSKRGSGQRSLLPKA